MSDAVTIVPDPPANKGMDYAFLKAEGTTLVQQMAGEIWTDYNEHDPGVTTLEQLCYALTELSYRAEFPLKDLLINRPGGRINPRRQALFIPRRILPCNPLTINDYRKLIVDRVHHVANVWLRPYRDQPVSEFVNGLYDISVYVPGLDPVCATEETEKICKRVEHVYCRHRNLCEDVHSIRALEPVRTVVTGDVSIGESSTPEAILAAVFFNIGNFLAPELRRRSLKSLIERGETPDRIFNGPLLRNGFIDDDQLQPKATRIMVQDVIRVMARTAGVASVRNVTVDAGRRPIREGNEWIDVPEDKILQIDARPKEDGSFTIRLFKNGIEYRPKPARVQRELDKLWADYRRTYKLALQYDEFFAVPQGTYRDLERYYSVQNQFPNVYGINRYGLPGNAPPPRKAQAKQFKAYLLAFDQLLADYFAQLAHVKDLYSIKYGLRHTYFYQYLYKSVPNIEPLLKENYEEGLRRIIDGEDPFVERRNRFLSFLLALYAEKLDESSVYDLTDDEREDRDAGERLMQARLDLLHNLVASTHNRGRGFDYLAAPSPRNIAGMEIKSRIQLGLDTAERRPLIDVLEEHGLELAESDLDASLGRPLTRHAEEIEEQFRPIQSFAEGQEAAVKEKRPIMTLGSQRVTEEFILAAAHIENYRIGSLPGDEAYAVVCRLSPGHDWRLVGKYPNLESAIAAVYYLAELIKTVHRHCRKLYIVEHTLLRFGRSRPDYDSVPEEGDVLELDFQHGDSHTRDFVYSFTITAVISMSDAQRGDPDYRKFVREVIRQNTPAHIAIDYCFLNSCRMREFESLYWAWRRALRLQEPREIRITSARLRKFLEECRRLPEPCKEIEPGC